MAQLLIGPRVFVLGSALALVLFAAGFVVFAGSLESGRTRVVRNADGIVVLTGGAARIEAGVELLSQGRAKRLLISGVHATTTRTELRRHFPEDAALFRCCIDLDRHALNTTGNAMQARSWSRAQGFTSLIVVTSSYHMPRTMVELRRAMPHIRLSPFTVMPRGQSLKTWWSDSGTARLLFMEYTKYVPALARRSVEWATGSESGAPALNAAVEHP